MYQELISAAAQVVAILLSIAISYGIGEGVKLVKARWGNEQYMAIVSRATTIVRYLQQADWLGLANEAKKEKALMELANFAQEKGIPVTYELLDQIIEEAVLDMKAALRPIMIEEGLLEG
jgi:hypothetical protein